MQKGEHSCGCIVPEPDAGSFHTKLDKSQQHACATTYQLVKWMKGSQEHYYAYNG